MATLPAEPVMMYVSLRDVMAQGAWPEALVESGAGAFLDSIAYEGGEINGTSDDWGMQVRLRAVGEVTLPIPMLGGAGLVMGTGPLGAAIHGVGFRWDAEIWSEIFSLRFPRFLLKPAIQDADGNWVANPDENAFTEIELPVGFTADSDGTAEIVWPGGSALPLSLPKSIIGDSGFMIEAQDVILRLNGGSPIPPAYAALGLPDTWRGVLIASATLTLPKELDLPVPQLTIQNCAIGSGGFSGTVVTPISPEVSGNLGGRPFTLTRVEVGFAQNALTACAFFGRLTLPFFEEPVDVVVSVTTDGQYLIRLAASSGLATISKTGVLNLTVDSLTFRLDNGLLTTILSGDLTPLAGAPALAWPTFAVKELAIDPQGNVSIEGGWINLPTQYALSLYGFRLEITRLGFGKTKDGQRWVGFSGALSLVDGLAAGVSAEGLRITWGKEGTPASLSMDGVGVELAIPGALSFRGMVSLMTSPERFDGSVRLSLPALDLDFDARITIGTDAGRAYYGLYLDTSLPVGLPIANSGLAVYGIAGLFANQMVPARNPDENWYQWYKRPASDGTTGVASLLKWGFRAGGMALGAGITIGTFGDNGFAFNGKALFVITFPGPVIMIEGRANILADRADLNDNREPVFRLFSVLDPPSGETMLALDAQYKFDSSGALIDIHGHAEAFFDWDDPTAWHVWLGKDEPRDKRIKAHLFHIFDADSYLMLSQRSLAIGGRMGWGDDWRFGPLRVFLTAFIEAGAAINWKPSHFHGVIGLGGSAGLRVYGFSVSVSVTADLAADVFAPFHLAGRFSAGINLPWPLPDFRVSVKIEFGPERTMPKLPLPVQRVGIEHPLVDTTWPLPRGQFLLPQYDGDGDGNVDAPSGPEEPAALAQVPVVPVDGRPTITFTRPVYDDALVGINLQRGGLVDGYAPEGDYEVIGNPENRTGPVKVRYALESVVLQKRSGSDWSPIAGAPQGSAAGPLYGSWQAVPSTASAEEGASDQVKLQLWARTPFFYGRRTGTGIGWAGQQPIFQCGPPPADVETCYDFANLTPALPPESTWTSRDDVVRMSWGADHRVTVESSPTDGAMVLRMLFYPSNAVLRLRFGRPVKRVRILLDRGLFQGDGAFDAILLDDRGGSTPRTIIPPQSSLLTVIDLVGNNLVEVTLSNRSERYPLYVRGICVTTGPTVEETSRRTVIQQHVNSALAYWYQTDDVLEPYTIYRLKVVTRMDARYDGELDGPPTTKTQTEYAYFQTSGPPGLAALSRPIDNREPTFKSGLDDLAAYVGQTVPPSRDPDAGDRPLLRRPVYRAYDVGVTFKATYVDLLYRMAHANLGLYLFDQSNRPARDRLGRLVAAAPSWRASDTLILGPDEQQWLQMITSGSCLSIDMGRIARDRKLVADSGYLLEPDSYYEARLSPLLLQEDFQKYASGTVVTGPQGMLGPWQALDQTTTGGPSSWTVESGPLPGVNTIRQTSNIGASTTYRPGGQLLLTDDPAQPAADRPSAWNDYRVSFIVRGTATGGQFGIGFRYQSVNTHYRYVIGPNFRRIVHINAGTPVVLVADNSFVFEPNRDYKVVIEAVGSELRVFQEDAPPLMTTHAALTAGTLAFYCWRSPGAVFQGIRVDDIRENARVLHRFQFTTSRYADFFHHVHSARAHRYWLLQPGAALTDAALAGFAAAAVSNTRSEVGSAEAAAYEELAAILLGAVGAQKYADSVELSRIQRTNALGGPVTAGALIRSPEPIEWRRTSITLGYRATQAVTQGLPAGPVKVAQVQMPTSSFPERDSVSLLLLEDADLTGAVLEVRGVSSPPEAWTTIYTFGAEQRLRAGTRVIIYAAGSGPAVPTAVERSSTFQKFFSTLGGVAEARILGPDGRIWHERQFLSSYASPGARWLRKADGTAFIVLPPSGNSAPGGNYRLTMTFDRLASFGPTSPALSQAGLSTLETATLDLPPIE